MSKMLGMSDEEFLKLNAPDPAPANDGAADGADIEEVNNDPAGSENQDDDDESDPTGSGEAGGEGDESGDDQNGEGDDAGAAGSADDGGEDGDADGAEGEAPGSGAAAAAPGSKDVTADPKPGDKSDPKGDGKAADAGDKDKAAGATEGGAQPALTQEQLQAFYTEVMKPFKANGKTVTPRTPDEVIRLMQMGAGFGKKLQDMQPHIKTLRLLEKENLLDPTELSFLIDIRNKNPEAIKKIIKEANIDPLDLNIEDNVNYVPVDRSVSDAEVRFEEALVDVKSRPHGDETIQIINQSWDKESLGLLWEQPELIEVFRTQRENGVYDKIVAEIEHQKTFGTLPQNTPFLKAYADVGKQLTERQALVASPSAQPATVTETVQPPAQPKVIDKRAQTPKPVVANGDKARAAASSSTSPKKAAAVINPLQMADDDFLKQFEGRL